MCGLHPPTPGTERDRRCTGGEDQAQPEDAQEEGTGTHRPSSSKHSITSPNMATEKKNAIFNLKTLAEPRAGRHLGSGKGPLEVVAAAPRRDGGYGSSASAAKHGSVPRQRGLERGQHEAVFPLSHTWHPAKLAQSSLQRV